MRDSIGSGAPVGDTHDELEGICRRTTAPYDRRDDGDCVVGRRDQRCLKVRCGTRRTNRQHSPIETPIDRADCRAMHDVTRNGRHVATHYDSFNDSTLVATVTNHHFNDSFWGLATHL